MYLYPLPAYGGMVRDLNRVHPYVEALRKSVSADTVLADIGTGAGFFAFLACQFGAKHVYAIEPNPSIQIAMQIARTLGFQDRITFIQDVSTRVELPERVDIMLEDMRGTFPWNGMRFASIADARRRFLKPSGVLISQQDRLYLSLVSVPEIYEEIILTPWTKNEYGLDMSVAHRYVVNQLHRRKLLPSDLFDLPQPFGTFDFSTLETADVAARAEWQVASSGLAHGFTTWFEALLLGCASFSTVPAENRTVYGNPFFAWPEPVKLAAGDLVSIELQGSLSGDDYDLRWDTRVFGEGNKEYLKASFKQGTMLSRIITPAEIKKAQPSYRPRLGAKGELRRFVLSQMDGSLTSQEIAGRLCNAFPERFASSEQALSEVISLVQRYG